MSTQIARLFVYLKSTAMILTRFTLQSKGKNIILSAKEPTWDEFFDSKSSYDDFLQDRFDEHPQKRGFD